MELHYFQKGFNYSQDGPGNRLVYHLQGCNLHCPWCSNPEGLSLEGGQRADIQAIAAEAESCRPMFFDGGGVTFTGGEATLQADALLALLKELKSRGIHTALETNGFSPRLLELLPYVDHLMMDCKHHDPEIHRSVTGGNCSRVYENMAAAVKAGHVLNLRIPLIGGFNASEEDASCFCDLFDALALKGSVTLELLRYHAYGKTKYEALHIPYTMGEEAYVSDACFRAIAAVFTRRGYPPIRT